jgi:hypothetical protein
MSFPQQVNVQPAPAVAGDFASANPRIFVNAGPGDLIVGSNGLYVGRFAWQDAAGNGTVANSANGIAWGAAGVNAPTGFVHRAQQGLNTTGPGAGYVDGTQYVPPGYPITLANGGDFWIVNSHATAEALPGQVAYASLATGLATFAASGTGVTGNTVLTSTIAAASAIAGTAYITGNVLTVVTSTGSTIYPGAIISGGATATGTQITSQISGTTGGVGTYYVSIPEQTVGSVGSPFTLAGTYGIMTMGATPSGTFNSGEGLSGTGVTPGTVLWGNIAGGSANGATWVVSPSQTASSNTFTAAQNVATKWVAQSSALPGELVKISSWAQG